MPKKEVQEPIKISAEDIKPDWLDDKITQKLKKEKKSESPKMDEEID